MGAREGLLSERMLLPLGYMQGLHRAKGGVGSHTRESQHKQNVFIVNDPCPVSLRSKLEPIKLEFWYNPITPLPLAQISRLGLHISEWQLLEAEVGSGFVGGHLKLVMRAGSGYHGPGMLNVAPKIQLFDGLMELHF